MKKILSYLFSLCMVLGLASCQKNIPAPDVDGPELDGPTGVISVKLMASDGETKATAIADGPADISSVQLFVFTTDGKLETSKYFDSYNSSTDLKITAKQGAGKTLYVVLNSARLNFSSIDRFENPSSSSIADLVDLSANTTEKVIMVGKNTVDVVEYDPNKTASPVLSPVTVHLKRLTAKVVLDQINVDFRNTALEGGTFTLNQVYLVNVVGKSPYGVQTIGTGTADTGIPVALPTAHMNTLSYWYNVTTLQSSPLAPAVTYDAAIADPTCSVSGSPKALGLMYLAYPNPADAFQESATAPSAPVHTSIVLKATVTSGGNVDAPINKVTYYTFDLPKLEANKLYRITKIDITMLGADNPGERVVTGKIDPTITVDDWTPYVQNLTYEF